MMYVEILGILILDVKMESSLQWKIHTVDLDPVFGSEQGGCRPVLIVSEEELNQILPIVNVLPITTKKHERFIYPNEVLLKKEDSGLNNDSIILCHQIRTIDKRRLKKKLGRIKDVGLRKEVYDSLLFQLGYSK